MKYSISSAILLLVGASSTLAAVVQQGDLSRKEYQKGLSRSFGPEVPYREYTTPSWFQRQKDYSQFTITDNAEDIAVAFAEAELTSSEFIVTNAYKSDLNGVTHVYLRQKVNGLEVLNGDININVDRFGQVISYGDSFARGINTANKQDATLFTVSKQINLCGVFEPLTLLFTHILLFVEGTKRP